METKTTLRNRFEKNTRQSDIDKVTPGQRPFSKINFILMGVCVALIVIGFMLMSGGGSPDGGYNPEIFSTRRIVVGPLLSFLGFLFMAGAIILPPDYFEKKKKQVIDK